MEVHALDDSVGDDDRSEGDSGKGGKSADHGCCLLLGEDEYL